MAGRWDWLTSFSALPIVSTFTGTPLQEFQATLEEKLAFFEKREKELSFLQKKIKQSQGDNSNDPSVKRSSTPDEKESPQKKWERLIFAATKEDHLELASYALTTSKNLITRIKQHQQLQILDEKEADHFIAELGENILPLSIAKDRCQRYCGYKEDNLEQAIIDKTPSTDAVVKEQLSQTSPHPVIKQKEHKETQTESESEVAAEAETNKEIAVTVVEKTEAAPPYNRVSPPRY